MKYRVMLNGLPIDILPARISAIPFNRTWPGKQRDPAQTEISYFTMVDMTEGVTLAVEVDAAIDRVDILPREFEVPYEVKEDRIVIRLDSPRKFTVEVNGYAEALHVFANAPDGFCAEEHEDILYFPHGEHGAGDDLLLYPTTRLNGSVPLGTFSL